MLAFRWLYSIEKQSVTNAVSVNSLRFAQIYFFAMCLFYAFIGIVAIIWGYFYVPETKGVSLENIEAFWRKGGHPKDKII